MCCRHPHNKDRLRGQAVPGGARAWTRNIGSWKRSERKGCVKAQKRHTWPAWEAGGRGAQLTPKGEWTLGSRVRPNEHSRKGRRPWEAGSRFEPSREGRGVKGGPPGRGGPPLRGAERCSLLSGGARVT